MTTEEKLCKIKDFRPIDDVFFEVIAEDKEVCQEILRTILSDDKLIVSEVITQSSSQNIYGRSVRLDALCTLGDERKCNIEVQRSNNDDHLRRARFNASSITVKDSDKRDKFKDVEDIIIVFISEFDFLKGGKTLYHIDKVIRETNELIDDGLQEIFVNTAIDDGSDIAELMSCFTKKEFSNSKFPKFSAKVKELKTTEGGADIVCEIMEKYINEAEIKTTIITLKDFKASDNQIIEQLKKRFLLTEEQAIEALQKYQEN